MLTHVRCLACGAKFNGRSGRSNTKAIVIYNVVAIGFALAFLLIFFWFLFTA